MKWISIIGAAAVLVVSVFIIGVATAQGELGTIKDNKTAIAGQISVYLGEAAVMTGTPIVAPTKYGVLLAIERSGKKFDVFCGAKKDCEPDQTSKSETEVQSEVGKSNPDLQINYYSGSCWVCTGGNCFKVC